MKNEVFLLLEIILMLTGLCECVFLLPDQLSTGHMAL